LGLSSETLQGEEMNCWQKTSYDRRLAYLYGPKRTSTCSPSDKAIGVLAGLKAAMGSEVWPAFRVMIAIAVACQDADLSDKECDWLYEEL
jgi:hypothetical protein